MQLQLFDEHYQDQRFLDAEMERIAQEQLEFEQSMYEYMDAIQAEELALIVELEDFYLQAMDEAMEAENSPSAI